MQKKITLLAALVMFSSFLTAQITFQKKFGGITTGYANVCKQTTDHGYMLAGFSQNLTYDFYLVKMDSISQITWAKTYGTAGNENLSAAIQTTDGGYMMAGFTSQSFNYDMYFVKTDANGDTLFTRSFGGYRNEGANSIIQTTDGGYLAAGTFTDNSTPPNTSLLLYKMNASGDSTWSTVLSAPGATSYEVPREVVQTTDGGYVIGGEYSFGQFLHNSYMIKINNIGNVEWNKTYQVTGNDNVASVIQTTDGGYAMSGSCIPAGGLFNNLFLIRTNSTGDTLWTATYGGVGLDDIGRAQQTTDGGFIIAGLTDSYGAGQGDAYLIKTNANGVVSWSKTYGGNQYDQFNAVSQTLDGGYLASGAAGSFGAGYQYVVKTDSLGNSNCFQNAASTITYHTPIPIDSTVLSNFISPSWVSVPLTVVGLLDSTSHIVCFNSTGIDEAVDNNIEASIYPNPVSDLLTISTISKTDLLNAQFRMSNLTGQEVMEGLLNSTNGKNQINVSHLQPGIYFLAITSNNYRRVYRIEKL